MTDNRAGTTGFETPQWLVDNARYERPTEIMVPLVEGIGPVHSYSEDRDGWYAYIGAAVSLPGSHKEGEWVDCDHVHVDKDAAWACAADLARQVADSIIEARSSDDKGWRLR